MFARPSRGLLDFFAAALCVWGATYHTPAGALVRDVVARARGTATTTRPLLAYYSGGLYDAKDAPVPVTPNPPPDDGLLATVPPGQALGRGVWAVTQGLEPRAKAQVDAVAGRYHGSLATPDDAATVVSAARADFPTDEAAVLALFVGYDVASYAVARARAEGNERAPLAVLARQLPPSSADALARAGTVLQLGTAYGLAWPVPAGTRVSSPFGWRDHPILGRGQLHTGVDLAVPEGTVVHAVAKGVVTRASEDQVNGRIVIIDHGFGVATAYCHNSRLLVQVGQRVEPGDVLAESGTTGRSTGPHLHYQLELAHKPVDPFSFRGRAPVLAGGPARSDL